jgi:hypothetical protein
MAIINGPYDDEDLSDGRRFKAPKALRRLQKQFTYDKKLEKFRDVFGRPPHGDDELEMFAENYLLEVYNSGDDEI